MGRLQFIELIDGEEVTEIVAAFVLRVGNANWSYSSRSRSQFRHGFRVLVLGGGGSKKRMTNEPLICIDRFAKWAAAASDDNVETN